MNTLEGRQVMVWTFMGNTRMYQALRDYGDRISQIGLFSFKVKATGEIYESGVAISNMLTYINKWPHIKWLLTVANDGSNSIFKALRDNTDGAQDMFLSILSICLLFLLRRLLHIIKYKGFKVDLRKELKTENEESVQERTETSENK